MLNITPYSRTSTISNNEQIPSSTRNMRSIECDLNSCNKEVSSEAIDRLFDRALNGTEPDRKIAENLIFDIFSSEKKPENVSYVVSKCVGLYNSSEQNENRIRSSNKLLYIYASSCNDADATVFSQSLTADAFDINTNMLSDARFLTDDDIYSQVVKLRSNFDLPVGITIHTPLQLNELSIDRFQVLTSPPTRPPTRRGNANLLRHSEPFFVPSPLNKVNLFPLNVEGKHWILLASCKRGAAVEALVFNSNGTLADETQAHINSLFQAEVSYINKSLQEHVPNGCGIFVYKAIEYIATNDINKPIKDSLNPITNSSDPTTDLLDPIKKSLNEFIRDFQTLSSEEKGIFNLSARRKIYSAYLDYKASPDDRRYQSRCLPRC